MLVLLFLLDTALIHFGAVLLSSTALKGGE